MKLVVIALLALGVSAGTAGSAGGLTLMPRCHTPDLHVYLIPNGAAAGSYAFDIAFQNRSAHMCFVYGYPGLGLEDAHHRAQPSRVTWGSSIARRDPGRHRIILHAGKTAFASMSGSDVPRGSEHCRSYPWLEVTPPDERTHRTVHFAATVCDHGHLTVTALSATRTARG
jgi:uncharacterized protein DUF4232